MRTKRRLITQKGAFPKYRDTNGEERQAELQKMGALHVSVYRLDGGLYYMTEIIAGTDVDVVVLEPYVDIDGESLQKALGFKNSESFRTEVLELATMLIEMFAVAVNYNRELIDEYVEDIVCLLRRGMGEERLPFQYLYYEYYDLFYGGSESYFNYRLSDDLEPEQLKELFEPWSDIVDRRYMDACMKSYAQYLSKPRHLLFVLRARQLLNAMTLRSPSTTIEDLAAQSEDVLVDTVMSIGDDEYYVVYQESDDFQNEYLCLLAVDESYRDEDELTIVEPMGVLSSYATRYWTIKPILLSTILGQEEENHENKEKLACR